MGRELNCKALSQIHGHRKLEEVGVECSIRFSRKRPQRGVLDGDLHPRNSLHQEAMNPKESVSVTMLYSPHCTIYS